MPKRIDGEDTVDNSTHRLHRLQADGWAVREEHLEFEYAELKPGGARVPIGATLTVRLIPTRG